MSYDSNRVALYLTGKLPPHYKAPIDKMYFIEEVRGIFKTDTKGKSAERFPETVFDFIDRQAKTEEQFFSMVLNKVQRIDEGKFEELIEKLEVDVDGRGESIISSGITEKKGEKSESLSLLKPLILTEGKTDAIILKTAWLKVNGHTDFDKKNYDELFNNLAPYRIESCDLLNGEKVQENATAKNLGHIVNYWKGDTTLIGLFDRDHSGFEGYRDGIDAKDNKIFEESLSDNNYLKVKYRKGKVYSIGMLYPISLDRTYDTTNRDFQKDRSSIEVEFYFKDDEIKNILEFKSSVDDTCSDSKGVYTKLNISSKKNFAEKVLKNASKLDFSNFESLFDYIEEILSNRYLG